MQVFSELRDRRTKVRDYCNGDDMNWYLEALRKYAVFEGRSRRKEYWMYFLISHIISFVPLAIDCRIGISPDGTFGVLSTTYALAFLIPAFAVTVRRLHDTGRNGLYSLLMLVPIPLFGLIVLLPYTAEDSQPGPNKYGPNPKEMKAI